MKKIELSVSRVYPRLMITVCPLDPTSDHFDITNDENDDRNPDPHEDDLVTIILRMSSCMHNIHCQSRAGDYFTG